MSRQRRNFNAKLNQDLVIELLKGEKDLNTLCNWCQHLTKFRLQLKKKFEQCFVVPDDKRRKLSKKKLKLKSVWRKAEARVLLVS